MSFGQTSKARGGGLKSIAKAPVSTLQQQEAQASQGRRDLHQTVDALRNDLHAHKADFATMGAQIAGGAQG
jgi:hypothetical protein